MTVHDLPHELISYIFSVGRDDDDRVIVPYLRTISSVCSVWRNVAISTSTLWSTIVYEPYAFSPAKPTDTTPTAMQIELKTSRVCERVRMFLARSRSASIDLVVIIRRHNEEQIRRIANIVMPHLWRCSSLTLWHEDDAVHGIFFPLPDRLERLEKLESHAQPIFLGAVTLFTKHSAPPLRSLCFKSSRGLPRLMDFVPTNTLTHLDLEITSQSIDQTKFMQFLGRCTVLEELRLPHWTIRELVPDNVIPVSLPSLKSLHANDTLALDFPMYLHTPNIVELRLHNRWVRQPELRDVRPTMLQMETLIWDRQSLLGLRHHHLMPFSSVKNLILRNCADVLVLVYYLAVFPGELWEAPDPPGAIRHPGFQGHHLLPRLEYLKITGPKRGRVYYEAGVAASLFRALLDVRPSLRVVVDPYVADDAGVRAFVERFGPRLAIVEWKDWNFWWHETYQYYDGSPSERHALF